MEPISPLVRNRSTLLQPYPVVTVIMLLVSGLIYVSYNRARSLNKLRQDWVSARHAKDQGALEALYCWEGVEPAERQRMKLLLAQEMEYPVMRTLLVELPSEKPSPGWQPNCPPVAGLYVEYGTEERLTVTYQVGRRGLLGHQLVIIVPER